MQYRQVFVGAALAAMATATPLARRDQNAVVTGAAAVTTINNSDGVGAGTNSYTTYAGDGSPGAGWPTLDQWVSFDDMFNANKPAMQQSCNGQLDASGNQVALNSDDEIQGIYDAIQAAATQSALDHRVILAVIMQESHGCVRVQSTNGYVVNPGLMQDYNGYYTCNDNLSYNHGGAVLSPCPTEYINGMVAEGAIGTAAGPGLATDVNTAQSQYGCTGAQCFYEAARIYNSGSIPAGGDLTNGGATSSYASDIANRLTGYLN